MSAFSRRALLNRSLYAGLFSGLTAKSYRATFAAEAPSERVRVGMIGVGNQGGPRNNMQYFLEHIEAMCDLDPRHLDEADAFLKKEAGRAATLTDDYRRLLDSKDLDAVVVTVPDQWHALMTIEACQAGKDVYVEKPDGHNMLEGQRMVAAMRKHKRIVQMGTQARSGEHFLSAIEYIRTGALGKVLVAKAWESTRQGAIGNPPDSTPPDGVDYDMWLGPAPKRPFNSRRFHGNWRWFFDYGSGDLGNDGVHRLDFARWALSAAVEAQGEAPLTIPTKISALGGKWYFDDMQEWPDTYQLNYELTHLL